MNVWLDLAKEYKLSIILGIWSIILWIWFFILWEPSVTPWIPPIIITIVVVITGLLSLIYSAWNSKKDNNGHPSKLRHEKWFYIWIIEIALLGGTWAFFLPLAINSSFGQDDGAALRQALIYTTGGVLGVITLGETHRKNTLEKTKNEQDHTRQVHAERRARYAKAVEQLADEKAPIRLGGAYTLVKLVDDWMDDEKTLPSKDKRRQEGQIIIDSLCAYIRSSFPLAERHDELTLSYEEYQQKYQDNQGKNQATQSVENSADNSTPKPEEHQDNKQSREEFVRDKSIFREEQEVRQTILSEIEKRLNSNKDKDEDGKGEVKPGTWSYFEYDFSNTVFSTTPDSVIVILVIHQISPEQPSPRALNSLERPSRTLASTRQPSPRMLTSLERPSRTLTSTRQPSPRTLTSPGRPLSKMLTSPRRSSRINQYLNTH